MGSGTNKTTTSKKGGVKVVKEISDRDKLIIDNYLETYNKSRSVMEVVPDFKHQSQANHLFNGIWNKAEVKAYVKERRNYIANQKGGLTIYEIAQELQGYAMADVTEILQCKTEDELKDLPPSTRRLIQDYTMTERIEIDRKGNENTVKTFKFKFVNKLDSIKELNKITGNYVIDNGQKTNNIDLSKLPTALQMQLLAVLEQQNKPNDTIIDV